MHLVRGAGSPRAQHLSKAHRMKEVVLPVPLIGFLSVQAALSWLWSTDILQLHMSNLLFLLTVFVCKGLFFCNKIGKSPSAVWGFPDVGFFRLPDNSEALCMWIPPGTVPGYSRSRPHRVYHISFWLQNQPAGAQIHGAPSSHTFAMPSLSARWARSSWHPGAQDLPSFHLPCGTAGGRAADVEPAEPVHKERYSSSGCLMGSRLKYFWEAVRVSDTEFSCCGALQ